MGQKVNPHGLRVGVIKDWDSRWFASKATFGDTLVEDYKIRELLKKKLYKAGVPSIEIERSGDKVTICISCAKPGMVIGAKGAEVDKLKAEMEKFTGKKVDIKIIEVKNPDMNAQLVAENIAQQLEGRVSFRRAMKSVIGRTMKSGAKGIKVTNSTSIGCAELLEKGQADLIVCNCPNSRLGSHFQTRVLKEFHDVFVANTDYFPVHTVQTELQELLNYPILMLSPKSTTSEYLREAFTAHNLKLLPEVELNSNDLLLDLARIGLGIACVPDYMLKENDQLTPLMLKEPLPGRQLILAQHDSLTVSQAAERFIEMFTSI